MKENDKPLIITQYILIYDLNKVSSNGIADQLIPRFFRNYRRHWAKCDIEKIPQ